MVAPGELSSFDTRLQEDSHCFKKPLVIASSRQDRSVSRRKASQLARRCVGLFSVSSGCSESREGVARWRVRRTVGSFGVASGFSSSLPHRRDIRRCRSRELIAVAAAEEGSSSPLQRAPRRRCRELVGAATAAHQGASQGIAIGELVGAAENYSPSPPPQQRVHCRWRAR